MDGTTLSLKSLCVYVRNFSFTGDSVASELLDPDKWDLV
jgi:hypothetical protein